MTSTEPTLPEVLQHTEESRPDEAPAFESVVQLRLEGDQTVWLALAPTELAVCPGSEHALHYDPAGRLVKVSAPDRFQRRSLSGRALLGTRLGMEEGGGLSWTILPAEDAEAMVTEARSWVATVNEALASGTAHVESATPSESAALARIRPAVAQAARFGAEVAFRDIGRFRAVYGRVAVLPPDQHNALVVQATEGCSYGACLFCRLYEGVHARRKTRIQFGLHVKQAIAYHGEALRACRSIFLGEANVLALPLVALRELFEVLHEHFECPPPEQTTVPATWWMGQPTRFEGVCSFLDAFSQAPHTTAEFEELHRLGLRHVYIGLETGDDALLRWLKKPATAATVSRCVGSLKQAGVSVGLAVLLGVGGQQFSEAHVRETSRLLNELPLDSRDSVYFCPLVISPGGKYAAKIIDRGIGALTNEQMREQEHAIRRAVRFDPGRGRPHMARYDFQTFIY
jgi:hypothetical protein